MKSEIMRKTAAITSDGREEASNLNALKGSKTVKSEIRPEIIEA